MCILWNQIDMFNMKCCNFDKCCQHQHRTYWDKLKDMCYWERDTCSWKCFGYSWDMLLTWSGKYCKANHTLYKYCLQHWWNTPYHKLTRIFRHLSKIYIHQECNWYHLILLFDNINCKYYLPDKSCSDKLINYFYRWYKILHWLNWWLEFQKLLFHQFQTYLRHRLQLWNNTLCMKK